MNYSRVILVGRTTKDPEINEKVVRFDLAVNRTKDETDFFKVSCFEKVAEFVKSYVKKGRLLLIEGTLRNNSWTDKEGKQRITTEIIANRVEILEKKESNNATPENWN